MSEINLKKLINSPYFVDIDNLIKLKEEFNKKYSNSTVDFIYCPSPIYSNLVTRNLWVHHVQYKGKTHNVVNEQIMQFPHLGPNIKLDNMKFGKTHVLSNIAENDESLNKFIKETVRYIVNTAHISSHQFDEMSINNPYSYDEKTNIEQKIKLIEQICKHPYIQGSAYFYLIKDDLEKQFERIHDERDPIYLWNVRNLLSMLPEMDGDSTVNFKLLL